MNVKLLPIWGVLLLVVQGCRSYEIVSPATLVASEKAIYVKRSGFNKDVERPVNITPIQGPISRSTWHSKGLFSKGYSTLKFENSPDVFLNRHGHTFWIKDQRGHYKVREEDRRVYGKGLRDLRRAVE